MEHWQRNLLVILTLSFECRGEDTITQSAEVLTATEGETVTLDCTFETTSSNPDLFWYKIVMEERTTLVHGLKVLVSRGVCLYHPNNLIVRMHAWLNILLILTAFQCGIRGDSVTQPTGPVTAVEGDAAMLNCTFETTEPNPYLFWYKQDATCSPKFVLMRLRHGSGNNDPEFKERFNATLTLVSTLVPLRIQSVQLSDSAIYYCALRPTVTKCYTVPVQKPAVLHNT
ncbi:immunoglobulin iota chain-like [Osmerus mordax]|uniref:immunoglobulin iota chain-like n=1 Tax=Osmerus mordax TaxID=8014 RepID=UPI00350FF3F2